jgi:hypothetical protein
MAFWTIVVFMLLLLDYPVFFFFFSDSVRYLAQGFQLKSVRTYSRINCLRTLFILL